MFYDDATFVINGIVDWHDYTYWSRNNLQWMREYLTQCPEKIEGQE